MFDIGIGELIALAVIGLLIFGPERLPKAAADAGKWARQIREMATSARKELSDSAGLDLSETMDGLREFRDLHPKRLAAGMFEDEPTTGQSKKTSEGKPASGQSFDPDMS